MCKKARKRSIRFWGSSQPPLYICNAMSIGVPQIDVAMRSNWARVWGSSCSNAGCDHKLANGHTASIQSPPPHPPPCRLKISEKIAWLLYPALGCRGHKPLLHAGTQKGELAGSAVQGGLDAPTPGLLRNRVAGAPLAGSLRQSQRLLPAGSTPTPGSHPVVRCQGKHTPSPTSSIQFFQFLHMGSLLFLNATRCDTHQ